jgi:hypothetical protein
MRSHHTLNGFGRRFAVVVVGAAVGCATARPPAASTPSPAPSAAPTKTAAPATQPDPPAYTTSVCPRVPLLPHPIRFRPDVPATAEGHCGRAIPTPGVERVPFGRNIDDALFCLDALYEGPDGLPLSKMLEAGLQHLARVYRQVHVTQNGNAISVSGRGHALSLVPVSDVPSFAVAFVRVAELARSVVPPSSISQLGSPEHVLLLGATASLAWGADFLVPAGAPTPPPAKAPPAAFPTEQTSSQQILGDDIAYAKLVHFTQGTAAGLRSALTQRRRWRGVIVDLRGRRAGVSTRHSGSRTCSFVADASQLPSVVSSRTPWLRATTLGTPIVRS